MSELISLIFIATFIWQVLIPPTPWDGLSGDRSEFSFENVPEMLLRPRAAGERGKEKITVQLADTAEREGLLSFLRLAIAVADHKYAPPTVCEEYRTVVNVILRLLRASLTGRHNILIKIDRKLMDEQNFLDTLSSLEVIEIDPEKIKNLISKVAIRRPREIRGDFINGCKRALRFIQGFSTSGKASPYDIGRALSNVRQIFYELEICQLGDKNRRLGDEILKISYERAPEKKTEKTIERLWVVLALARFTYLSDESAATPQRVQDLQERLAIAKKRMEEGLSKFPNLANTKSYKGLGEEITRCEAFFKAIAERLETAERKRRELAREKIRRREEEGREELRKSLDEFKRQVDLRESQRAI